MVMTGWRDGVLIIRIMGRRRVVCVREFVPIKGRVRVHTGCNHTASIQVYVTLNNKISMYARAFIFKDVTYVTQITNKHCAKANGNNFFY